MDKVQSRRGGDADGPRSRPKDEHEDKQEKLLSDELDDSFPASIRLPARSRPARNRLRPSRAGGIDAQA